MSEGGTERRGARHCHMDRDGEPVSRVLRLRPNEGVVVRLAG